MPPLYNKKNYVAHIRNIKQALGHGLHLKKVHKPTEFCQEAWLKTYIDMNTELKKEEKDFYKLMNNAVFGKGTENVKKYRDIKLITTDKKIIQLVPKPYYHTTKWFSESSLAIEMEKIKVKMNESINLGFSILEISKTLMYEFWCDYMKPKYKEKGKLLYRHR